MLSNVLIIGLASAFWALILHRKSGPGESISDFRAAMDGVWGLRKLFGETQGCETCAIFWLAAFFSGGLYAFPPLIVFLQLSAAASLALWLAPTIAVQVGGRE